MIGAEIDPAKVIRSSRALNYLSALYQDTSVILEFRDNRAIACCRGTYMALGLEVGVATANQTMQVATRDWLNLSKIIECFPLEDSARLSAQIADSEITFLCEEHGWALTFSVALRVNPLALPSENLKSVVNLNSVAASLMELSTKLGEEAEEKCYLEFGYSVEKAPVARVVNRNGDKVGTLALESINPPNASRLSINPAHLHDGIVLLKNRTNEPSRAKMTDSPDCNSWMLQCIDRPDFLLVSRFR